MTYEWIDYLEEFLQSEKIKYEDEYCDDDFAAYLVLHLDLNEIEADALEMLSQYVLESLNPKYHERVICEITDVLKQRLPVAAEIQMKNAPQIWR